MIDEPGRRRVDSRRIDDQSSIGRMKNIAQHVGSGPWPRAMRVVDSFEVMCASTKVLNLISEKKYTSGLLEGSQFCEMTRKNKNIKMMTD